MTGPIQASLNCHSAVIIPSLVASWHSPVQCISDESEKCLT